jgi:glutamyl-tRNA synthetase/nondiscriminating glutamyl-tRNA synthetase
MRVRFAPSPTGHLHVGNARTALFNWLLARGHGGTFILRIEDTDLERSTRQSEQRILDDLRWMGLQWDEGVESAGVLGPYRQTERFDIYRAYTEQLLTSGAAYRCFCSEDMLEAERRTQLAAGLPPRYAGTCRNLTADEVARRIGEGQSAVVRLRVPAQREVHFDDEVRGRVTFHTDVIGDPVLVRSDGVPAYNYAVVIDDHLMQVTHVIRGEDHISNTPRQVLIYEAFGWTPPAFAHLSLVLGPDHAPLSKRHGATSVAEFRQKGYLPEALVNYLALIGWSPRRLPDGETAEEGVPSSDELVPAVEMARRFRLSDVSHSAGVFDEQKLAWVNRHYLKQCEPARLVREALPFLQDAGLVTGPLSDAAAAWLRDVLPPTVTSVDRLAQIPERLVTIFQMNADAVLDTPALANELADPAARAVALALARLLETSSPLESREQFRALAAQVKEATGQKGRALFHPMRVVLTGAAEGPELDLLVPAIDRAAALPADAGLSPVVSCRSRAIAIATRLTRHSA